MPTELFETSPPTTARHADESTVGAKKRTARALAIAVLVLGLLRVALGVAGLLDAGTARVRTVTTVPIVSVTTLPPGCPYQGAPLAACRTSVDTTPDHSAPSGGRPVASRAAIR